jgi:hypothetical protein
MVEKRETVFYRDGMKYQMTKNLFFVNPAEIWGCNSPETLDFRNNGSLP